MSAPWLVGRRVRVHETLGTVLDVSDQGGGWRLLVLLDAGQRLTTWSVAPELIEVLEDEPGWIDRMGEKIAAAYAAVVTGDPVTAERRLEQALDIRDANRSAV